MWYGGRALRGSVVCVAMTLLYAGSSAHAESFTDALTSAYHNNPSLEAERAKLRATDEQVAQALGGWRPDIEADAEAGKARQNASGNGFPVNSGNVTPRDTNLTITQPVFSGFRTVAEVRSAKAAVMAQRADLADAEQKLLLDAAKAYLDVVEDQRTLAIDQNQESVLQTELDEVKDRLHIGELKKTDVAQAQSRLKGVMVSRLQAEGDLASRRMTYMRVVGQMPDQLEQPDLTLDLPKTDEDVVNLALRNNPVVIAAAYGAQAAHADIISAQGNLLPQVNLVGSLTDSVDQSSLSPERENSASIVAKMSVPLYRSGIDYSKTRAAQQAAAQKKFELQDARDRTRESTQNAWEAFTTAQAAVKGFGEVVDAASDALDGVRTEAKFGTRTTLDILNAEQELLQDKISLVKAEHDEALALLELRAAIGELTAESLHLPVTIYDPAQNYNRVHNQWAGFAQNTQDNPGDKP